MSEQCVCVAFTVCMYVPCGSLEHRVCCMYPLWIFGTAPCVASPLYARMYRCVPCRSFGAALCVASPVYVPCRYYVAVCGCGVSCMCVCPLDLWSNACVASPAYAPFVDLWSSAVCGISFVCPYVPVRPLYIFFISAVCGVSFVSSCM